MVHLSVTLVVWVCGMMAAAVVGNLDTFAIEPILVNRLGATLAVVIL